MHVDLADRREVDLVGEEVGAGGAWAPADAVGGPEVARDQCEALPLVLGREPPVGEPARTLQHLGVEDLHGPRRLHADHGLVRDVGAGHGVAGEGKYPPVLINAKLSKISSKPPTGSKTSSGPIWISRSSR